MDSVSNEREHQATGEDPGFTNQLLNKWITKVENTLSSSNRMFDLSDKELQDERKVVTGMMTMDKAIHIQGKAVKIARNAIILSKKDKTVKIPKSAASSIITRHCEKLKKSLFSQKQVSNPIENDFREKSNNILRNSDKMFELSEELLDDIKEIDNATKLLDMALDMQERSVKTAEMAVVVSRKMEAISSQNKSTDTNYLLDHILTSYNASKNATNADSPPRTLCLPINNSTNNSLRKTSSILSNGVQQFQRDDLIRKTPPQYFSNAQSSLKKSKMATPTELSQNVIESALKFINSQPSMENLASQQAPVNSSNIIVRNPNNVPARGVLPNSLPVSQIHLFFFEQAALGTSAMPVGRVKYMEQVAKTPQIPKSDQAAKAPVPQMAPERIAQKPLPKMRNLRKRTCNDDLVATSSIAKEKKVKFAE